MLVTSSINSDIGQHLQFLQCFIQGYFCQLALYSAYLWLPEGESIKGSPRDATLFVYAPFSDPIHPQQRICNRLPNLHCCHCHRLLPGIYPFPEQIEKKAQVQRFPLLLSVLDLEPSSFYNRLEVKGPLRGPTSGCTPLGLLDLVLHAHRALRPCYPRNGAMIG